MTRHVDIAEKIDNPSALTQEQGNIIYKEIVEALRKMIKLF